MAAEPRVRVVVTPVAMHSVPMTGSGPGGTGKVPNRLAHCQSRSAPLPVHTPFIEDVVATGVEEAMSRARENGREPLRLTYHIEFELA